MRIEYVNSKGIAINLNEWPIAIKDITQVFGKAWSYDLTEFKSSNKSNLDRFYRTKIEKSLDISIFADSKNEFETIMNEISEVIECDVIERKCGRLYVGIHYIECYIASYELSDYEELFNTVDGAIKIIAPNPFWIKESAYTFNSYGVGSNDNKKYQYKYSYRYANGMSNTAIVNENFTESNFEIVIYGPCINPQINVGSNRYRVFVVLEDGEYLKIKSRQQTIEKVSNSGGIENAFNAREKSVQFFKKIDTGRQSIVWPGNFNFDLTLLEERSEPMW